MLRTCLATGVALALLVHASGARAQGAPPWPDSPAKAADPPALLPKAPAESTPISITGTDIAPPRDLLPATAAAPGPMSEEAKARVRELEMRVAIDEARITKLENTVSPFRNLSFFGYVQLQYRLESDNAAASPNLQPNGSLPPGIGSNAVIARPDGTTTNNDAFRLRRTRLGARYESDVVRVYLQMDLLPPGGPVATQNTIARNAEVTGIAHWSKKVRTEFTGGLMNVPFRLETEELSLERPFIERTWASLNLFPTERDLGIHAKTFALDDRLVVDAGILNGQRLGEPKFTIQPDLNAQKDYFASVAVKKLGPAEVSLAGYYGTGVIVDTTLVRVKNYARYAGNLGARAAYTFFPKLGESRVVGEILLGKNMDTGVVYPFALPFIRQDFTADAAGYGERAIYIRVEQELTRWGIAGFRFDTYTPDVASQNDARDTYTFMAGRAAEQASAAHQRAHVCDRQHPSGRVAPRRRSTSCSTRRGCRGASSYRGCSASTSTSRTLVSERMPSSATPGAPSVSSIARPIAAASRPPSATRSSRRLSASRDAISSPPTRTRPSRIAARRDNPHRLAPARHPRQIEARIVFARRRRRRRPVAQRDHRLRERGAVRLDHEVPEMPEVDRCSAQLGERRGRLPEVRRTLADRERRIHRDDHLHERTPCLRVVRERDGPDRPFARAQPVAIEVVRERARLGERPQQRPHVPVQETRRLTRHEHIRARQREL